MEGNLNRRSFVKGAALSAAGLIAGGALAACSPAAGTSESKSDSAQTTGANNAEQRWSFEIAPDPIGDDLVTETVETDVVVVGGGMSGLVAAASCAENGLKVTLISASKAPVSRGGSNNGVYSKVMEEMGIPRMDPARSTSPTAATSNRLCGTSSTTTPRRPSTGSSTSRPRPASRPPSSRVRNTKKATRCSPRPQLTRSTLTTAS